MLRIKIIGISLAVTCLALLATGGFRTASKERKNALKTIQITAEPGTFEYYAQVAKSEGKDRIEILGPTFHSLGNAGSTTLDDALADFSVVVARLNETKVFSDNRTIGTWYKFKISEALLSRNTNPAPTWGYATDGPKELRPIDNDEFLTSADGGTIKFDGVTIAMSPPFKPFEKDREYLLFIVRYQSGLALVAIGPAGIFEINGDSLKPLKTRDGALQTRIMSEFNGSLSAVKQYIKKKTGNN